MTRTGTLDRLRLALVSGLFLASAACTAPPGGSAGALATDEAARIEKEIRQAEASFNGAYERNDLAAYWIFFADDLSQFFDSGRVSLEQYKKDWTTLIEAGGAILEARLDDLQIRVSPRGDAAGAAYRLFIRMRDPKGQESSTWYLESDTWFRHGDRWQVVQLHYSEQHQPGQAAAPATGGMAALGVPLRPGAFRHRVGPL
jgi:ketosteroid isomerase-like protein